MAGITLLAALGQCYEETVFIGAQLIAVKPAIYTRDRRRIEARFIFLAGALMVATVSCERRGGAGSDRDSVVVYSSVDEVYARPVLDGFTTQTGIPIKMVSDTEETKSSGLLNRLLAERARPQADVFWSGDPIRAAVLMAHQVSEPYRSAQAAGLPAQFSEAGGHFTSFSARARVMIYNTNPGEGDGASRVNL